jgi:DNA-binding PadR family transcriptional regulator
MLNNIILGMLCTGQAMTGYELKKCITVGGGVFYRTSYGSLYPALKKMEEQGLVVIAPGATTNGRGQKAYIITPKGEQAFHNWLCAPMEINEGTAAHLAKVYFFDRLDEERRRRYLVAYEEANYRYLQSLIALYRDFTDRHDKEGNYYRFSTLYYGIVSVGQIVAWCRHIREMKPLEDYRGYTPEIKEVATGER